MKKLLLAAIILQACNLPDFPLPIQPTPRPTDVVVPTAIPTLSPSPTSIVPTPPVGGKEVCSGPQKAPDGPGGFLWKNGDSTKKLVVLLPGKFKKGDRVTVFGLKGKAENLQFTGFGNPDSGGDRQHWRGSQATGRYQGKVEVFTNDSKCTYTFKNMPRVD